MNLAGRVALITGAGRRVGRAIALRLAQSGMHVAVHYATSRDEALQTAIDCRALAVSAEALAADLSDPAAAPRLVQETLTHFGRLDVLVNNASVFERMTMDDFSLQAWQHTLQVNLTAPLQLAHAACPELRRNQGRIVNLCDVAVWRPWPDHLAYITSKGALETLTRVLARALAPQVNVVGVAPGVAAWPDSYDESTRRRLTARIPLRRPGAAEDIAAAVEFVLRSGDYITGAIIPVDGGRHLV